MAQQLTFTRDQLNTLLFATIDMFVEWRDVHGYDEEDSRFKAVGEMFEGLDAEIELVESSELKAPSMQVLTK